MYIQELLDLCKRHFAMFLEFAESGIQTVGQIEDYSFAFYPFFSDKTKFYIYIGYCTTDYSDYFTPIVYDNSYKIFYPAFALKKPRFTYFYYNVEQNRLYSSKSQYFNLNANQKSLLKFQDKLSKEETKEFFKYSSDLFKFDQIIPIKSKLKFLKHAKIYTSEKVNIVNDIKILTRGELLSNRK